MKIEQLEARIRAGVLELEAFQVKIDADQPLTPEEKARSEVLMLSIPADRAEIEHRRKMQSTAVLGREPYERITEPQQPATAAQVAKRQDVPIRTHERVLDDPKLGYKCFGEQARDVYLACKAARFGGDLPIEVKQRLAPTTYGSESSGTDGGYAVAPDFRAQIRDNLQGEDALLPRTDLWSTGSNSIEVPQDANPDWDNASGIRIYWDGEATQITQSKPKVELGKLVLHKQTALVPMTSELLEDAPAMEGYLMRKVPRKMSFNQNLKLVQGTGVGEPLGIINAPATVSAPKVASQDATTVVALNIVDMWARMYAPSRRTAIWLINQDIEPQLLTMSMPGKDETGTFIAGTTIPMYQPPTGLSASPFATLLGRPVIYSQACETLGSVGDIIFWDPKEYWTGQKAEGVRQDISIHLFFDFDTTAFRFIYRLGGMPWWRTAVSPRSGSATLSCMVTLAVRA